MGEQNHTARVGQKELFFVFFVCFGVLLTADRSIKNGHCLATLLFTKDWCRSRLVIMKATTMRLNNKTSSNQPKKRAKPRDVKGNRREDFLLIVPKEKQREKNRTERDQKKQAKESKEERQEGRKKGAEQERDRERQLAKGGPPKKPEETQRETLPNKNLSFLLYFVVEDQLKKGKALKETKTNQKTRNLECPGARAVAQEFTIEMASDPHVTRV